MIEHASVLFKSLLNNVVTRKLIFKQVSSIHARNGKRYVYHWSEIIYNQPDILIQYNYLNELFNIYFQHDQDKNDPYQNYKSFRMKRHVSMIMLNAIRLNHISIVQYMIEKRSIDLSKSVDIEGLLACACEHGRFDILVYLDSFLDDVLDRRSAPKISVSDLDILEKWISVEDQKRRLLEDDDDDDRVYSGADRYNDHHVDLRSRASLKMLRSFSYINALHAVPRCKNMQMLEWVANQVGEFYPFSSRSPVDNAVNCGNLDAVRWFFVNRPSYCRKNFLQDALNHGHQHIAQWLLENNHIPENTNINLDPIATNKHLDCLEWSLNSGLPTNSPTLEIDFSDSSLVVIEWLQEQSPKKEGQAIPTSDVDDYINNFEAIHWLHCNETGEFSVYPLDIQTSPNYIPYNKSNIYQQLLNILEEHQTISKVICNRNSIPHNFPLLKNILDKYEVKADSSIQIIRIN